MSGDVPGIQKPPSWLCRLAAGVDAGAAAALAVLGWFALHSRLLGEPWWAKFNMAAAAIYGSDVFWMGRSRATLAGAALLFLVYTLLGVIFALLAGRRGAWRSLLLALLWMGLWHMVAERFVWPWLDGAAPQYFSRLATAPAHLAAAILLLRSPSRLQKLESLFQPEPLPPALPPAPPDAAGDAETQEPAPRADSDHC
ncbi:MAG: hypothetical protein NZR01_13640 [Bryobacteraceae bacterium]|nr:hypothetical protein [Bryobacteraceae bacterium]